MNWDKRRKDGFTHGECNQIWGDPHIDFEFQMQQILAIQKKKEKEESPFDDKKSYDRDKNKLKTLQKRVDGSTRTLKALKKGRRLLKHTKTIDNRIHKVNQRIKSYQKSIDELTKKLRLAV